MKTKINHSKKRLIIRASNGEPRAIKRLRERIEYRGIRKHGYKKNEAPIFELTNVEAKRGM